MSKKPTDASEKIAHLEQDLSYAEGILNTMSEPLVVLDSHFRIKSANAAFYKIFPVFQEETEGSLLYNVGNHAWDIHELHEALEKILPTKASFQDLELTFTFPTLGTMVMSVNGTRLQQASRGEQLILLAMQDITERALLQKRNESFVSTASHELRTPVTTIKTLIQILQKRFEESVDTTLVEYLTRMDDQIEQLTRLVNDLLDVSKIKANKLSMEEKMFDLDVLAKEIVQNCQIISPSHKLVLCGETSGSIKGDRSGISRVFINLIVNAVKYSPKAHTIIITLSRDEHLARVDVQDFGIGIAKNYQERIFERFFQIENEEARNFSGLGIGLYISGAIIAQHGGRISLTSKKNVGSTFSFTLPMHERRTDTHATRALL